MQQLLLNRGIYYRLYEDECYVWNTKLQKQYIFNSVVYDILELINLHGVISTETLLQQLLDKYDGSENEMSEVLFPFLNDMQKEGIIQINLNPNLVDIEQGISQSFSDKKILFSVLFEATYKCNEKCQHCYVDSPCQKNRKELNTYDAKQIIDNLHRANVGEITFSGGEFFTRPDAVELVEYAAKKGFMINIFSNGTLLDSEKILRIAKCNIRSYQTSIYGATAKTHDMITTVAGSFEKTIQTLDTFSKLGIATCIKTTMMNNNAHEYENLIQLSEKMKSEIQVGLSIIPTMLKSKSNSKFRLDENNLLKINIAEKKRFDETIEKLPTESKGLCNAGFSNLTINPYGDILICTGMNTILGNALNQEIMDVWESSDFLKEWRKKTVMDVKCMNDCQYAEYCSFCPAQAYLETGDCFSKYDEACMLAKTQFKTEEVLSYENCCN